MDAETLETLDALARLAGALTTVLGEYERKGPADARERFEACRIVSGYLARNLAAVVDGLGAGGQGQDS